MADCYKADDHISHMLLITSHVEINTYYSLSRHPRESSTVNYTLPPPGGMWGELRDQTEVHKITVHEAKK